MSATDSSSIRFDDFELLPSVTKALQEVGYETPSPIQAKTIPLLLQGRDVVGQAQTGTGKTAAFALPLISRIDLKLKSPQLLVLAPTRELAIQVAEAFQKYAMFMKDFHILPIYGGQEYGRQIQLLKRGVQVVVGTPGRVMDHMRRGTLKLDQLRALVLDEADEMLRMGFIDDVEWILEQTPAQRQIALFSATMPPQIRKIATQYLNQPEEITIQVKTTTASTIRQRYWLVSGLHKLDALSRLLEVEQFDAMIIFVRTKTATTELAEKLQARGYATAALNGDIVQKQREKIIEQIKNGKLDILVATDVAARGLDVERITHVINYDIPYDSETYVHRIGRTGRAGREGDAILFVAPRERRMLAEIEKTTRQKIAPLELPSTEVINDKRIAAFKQRITDTLASKDLEFYLHLLAEYQQEHGTDVLQVAAALASIMQDDKPLLLAEEKSAPRQERAEKQNRSERTDRPERKKKSRQDDEEMETFRIEVGNQHGVRPSNIVGAIANEAGLESQYIGHIKIFDDHSLVDLPEGMPEEIFKHLKNVWVSGQKLRISRLQSSKPAKGRKKPSTDRGTSGTKSKAASKGKKKPRKTKQGL